MPRVARVGRLVGGVESGAQRNDAELETCHVGGRMEEDENCDQRQELAEGWHVDLVMEREEGDVRECLETSEIDGKL